MENRFIVEARNQKAEADRNGRVALESLIRAVLAFWIWIAHSEDGGWWWLPFWASIAFGLHLIVALEARWYHRTASRVSLEYYQYSDQSRY